MAQRETYPTGIVFLGSSTQAGEITSLRGTVATGQTVRAQDLNRIATLINNMNGHYHSYSDQYQAATYGNTGDRGTYSETKNTNNIDGVVTAPTNTTAGATITASRHQELRTSVNTLYNHVHGIADRTS